MSVGRPGYAKDPATGQLLWNGYFAKPNYFASSGQHQVTVEASDSRPAHFVIGGQVFTVTSNVVCNFNTSGIGGLDEGTAQASTLYYLYGVNDDGAVKLIMSTRDPTSGPRGVGAWTYIGAFPTRSGSPTRVYGFTASNGTIFMAAESETNDLAAPAGSYESAVFSTMPTTAKAAWVHLSVIPDGGGVGAGQTAYASGNGSNWAIAAICQVNGRSNWDMGWIPVITSQTLYQYITSTDITNRLKLFGWYEPVHEYK